VIEDLEYMRGVHTVHCPRATSRVNSAV